MATATATPSPNPTHKRNVPRRRRVLGRRRRVGDEDNSDEGVQSAVDLGNDDSLTEGSIASDERDAANDSDTSNIDEASPTMPMPNKPQGDGALAGEGRGSRPPAASAPRAPEGAANGPSPSDTVRKSQTVSSTPNEAQASTATPRAAQPAIVSSSAAPPPRRETAWDRHRREHDLYRQRRDEDPSFVPNRGAFFMHDHRGAGPAANGFRPFSRPGRGGRGRGGFGGSYSPMHGQFHQVDPTANQPWAHDMHEVVTQPHAPRLPILGRQNLDAVSQYGASQYAGSQYAGSHYAGSQYAGSQYGGSQYGGSRVMPPMAVIPTCPPSSTPINRSMSVEKPLGTLTVRVFFPPMKEPVFFEKFKVMQYTKLPDHRPPLRRDKAVVIDLPGHPKRQIFPAVDRSFIFIPRALRPNQQRTRGGRTRSVMGSISGFSRRTSVFGGSYYNGSMYSPSVALSRRSSIAQDAARDFIISPAGSVIPGPPMSMENTARPVVRLPPAAAAAGPPLPNQTGYPVVDGQGPPMHMPPPMVVTSGEPSMPSVPSYVPSHDAGPDQQLPQNSQSQPAEQSQSPSSPVPTQQASQPSQPSQPSETSSLSTVPPPQHHPLPQKPVFQENRPSHNLPMHQPRPQKAVSVDNIEPPAQPTTNQPYSMAFHQQVPIPMATGFPPTESHSRHPSYQSHTTGTPLSQIPERAIHAAPFQPNVPPNQQQMAYPQPPNGMGAPAGQAYYAGASGGYMIQPAPPPQGYFYPTPPNYPSTMAPPAGMPPYVPAGAAPGPAGPGPSYGPAGQVDASNAASGPRNMVAQEVNGMVYYVDASQMPAMQQGYPGYSQAPMAPMPQVGYMPGVGGMVTPVPADGYYYGGQPGMVYYPQ